MRTSGLAGLTAVLTLALSAPALGECNPKPDPLGSLLGDLAGVFERVNPTYSTRYVNSSVAGRDANGGLFAVVAGKHEENFPYFHEDSKWDNALIYIDGQGYAVSDRTLDDLVVERDGKRARIAYRGPLEGTDGTVRDVEIDLVFRAQPHERRLLGKPVDVDGVPGMRWKPASLELDPDASHASVDGREIELAQAHGELEQGELTHFKHPALAFKYDYVGLTQPDTGYSYLDFTTRSLRNEGVVGRAVDWFTRKTASMELTFDGGEPREGNVHDVDDEAEVLVEDRVDLGLAHLDRQLIVTSDGEGRPVVGLREIFHPAD